MAKASPCPSPTGGDRYQSRHPWLRLPPPLPSPRRCPKGHRVYIDRVSREGAGGGGGRCGSWRGLSQCGRARGGRRQGPGLGALRFPRPPLPSCWAVWRDLSRAHPPRSAPLRAPRQGEGPLGFPSGLPALPRGSGPAPRPSRAPRVWGRARVGRGRRELREGARVALPALAFHRQAGGAERARGRPAVPVAPPRCPSPRRAPARRGSQPTPGRGWGEVCGAALLMEAKPAMQ